VLDLQQKFSNQLGHLPTSAIDFYVQSRLVKLTLENGVPAGYILGRPSFRWNRRFAPITQAAVCMDAQRRKHGLKLVEQWLQDMQSRGIAAAQAMCRSDLEANEFWLAAGFDLIAAIDTENARKKPMFCWRRAITGSVPAGYWQLPPVIGCRPRRTDAMKLLGHSPKLLDR
jgi:hypothetical protein